jgi:hypothetical protein
MNKWEEIKHYGKNLNLLHLEMSYDLDCIEEGFKGSFRSWFISWFKLNFNCSRYYAEKYYIQNVI